MHAHRSDAIQDQETKNHTNRDHCTGFRLAPPRNRVKQHWEPLKSEWHGNTAHRSRVGTSSLNLLAKLKTLALQMTLWEKWKYKLQTGRKYWPILISDKGLAPRICITLKTQQKGKPSDFFFNGQKTWTDLSKKRSTQEMILHGFSHSVQGAFVIKTISSEGLHI